MTEPRRSRVQQARDSVKKRRAKLLALGLCPFCGGKEPLHPKSTSRGANCLKADRERKRQTLGCDPHEQGKRGRPPLTGDDNERS